MKTDGASLYLHNNNSPDVVKPYLFQGQCAVAQWRVEWHQTVVHLLIIPKVHHIRSDTVKARA